MDTSLQVVVDVGYFTHLATSEYYRLSDSIAVTALICDVVVITLLIVLLGWIVWLSYKVWVKKCERDLVIAHNKTAKDKLDQENYLRDKLNKTDSENRKILHLTRLIESLKEEKTTLATKTKPAVTTKTIKMDEEQYREITKLVNEYIKSLTTKP